MQKIDRERLTSHIKDENFKISMFRALDIVEWVMLNHKSRWTQFLDMWELKNLKAILNSFKDIKYIEEGGNDLSERRTVGIYMDYQDADADEIPLSFLEVKGNFKYRSIGHRDFLGSILALGIKRETLGDIYVYDDKAQIICQKNISSYILSQLEKVSTISVKVSEITKEEICPYVGQIKEDIFVVNSIRLDLIISGIFHIKRQDAQGLIKNNKVKVNYEPILKSDFSPEKNSVISVKGIGKGKYVEVIQTTSKCKYRIKTCRFI